MLTEVYKNCEKMLLARDYSRVDKNNLDKIIYNKPNKKKVIIFFLDIPKLTVAMVKEYYSYMVENEIDHSIIIYKDCVTPSAKKTINNLYDLDKNIEIFIEDELMYNLTEHRFYCPHFKVNDIEAQKIKKKMGGKFPSLLSTDPVVRYFAFPKNSLIKVIRKNDFVTYRIVK